MQVKAILPRSGDLELAIYRTVISILDCYPAIQDMNDDGGLFARIHQCVTDNPDYGNLVGALAAVRL